MQRIYLDYAATTPVDPAIRRAMEPYFSEKFGNPGSLHTFGQEAIAAVDKARETVAKSIGADFREIIFTGSATEANNLALRGSVRGLTRTGRARLPDWDGQGRTRKGFGVSQREVRDSQRPRIIISAVEHESVRETARDLEKEGVEVVEIPVSREGVVDILKLEEALNDRTVLVSVMYANNEIGTIQPVAEISKIIRNFRVSRVTGQASGNRRHGPGITAENPWPVALDAWPLFHTDAVQAFQFLDCNVEKLGVDMMTLSAHKIYGPKGVGALYTGNRVWGLGSSKNGKKSGLYPNPYTLTPVLTGGGQEFSLRSGTENVPAVVGFAEAARVAARMRKKESMRVGALRKELWEGIKETCPEAEMNGAQEQRCTLPNILNVYFPGRSAQDLLTKCDVRGLAVSAGPACTSRSASPSRILHALGYLERRAKESVRFSMGKYTTREEIRRAIHIIALVTAL